MGRAAYQVTARPQARLQAGAMWRHSAAELSWERGGGAWAVPSAPSALRCRAGPGAPASSKRPAAVKARASLSVLSQGLRWLIGARGLSRSRLERRGF